MLYAEELLGVEVEALLRDFRDCCVCHVRRLNSGPDRKPTALLVLTFYSAVLPVDVKVGYMIYKIRKFYPRPLQGFRCLNLVLITVVYLILYVAFAGKLVT